MTLNDLQWHNGRNFFLISPNVVAFRASYIKLTEAKPTVSATEI